jgi:tetratricopeptide (TPR) repeat protein
MITRTVATLVMVFSLSVLEAGTFAGLEPGVSRKADADRALGQPIREVTAGLRYDYKATAYDARRISVEFSPETGVISSIDLYLAQQYSQSDYRSWFELGEPTATSFDDAGNRVESYAAAGISLHFDGPGNDDLVRFFRHFSPLPVRTSLDQRTAPTLKQPPPPPNRERGRTTDRNTWSAEQFVAVAEQAERDDDWAGLGAIVEEGLRIYPDQACLWNLRGSFFYNGGGDAPLEIRRDELLRSALRAYQLVPDYDHTVDLAWAYYKVFDDCTSANYYLEQIEEEATSKHASLIYLMGTCYERNGKIEAAIRYYQRYLQREPDTPQAAKVRDRLYVLDR